MAQQVWKAGQLARLTGLTVRTLHHYDQLGLLSPSARSEAGHRLYTADDLSRLQQIVSLKQLGLALSEIMDWLQDPGYHPEDAVRIQLERVSERISSLEELRGLLEDLLRRIREHGRVTAEQAIKLIEVMVVAEKYFTPEQLETLKKRAEILGPELIQNVENEWPELIAKVRAAMEQNLPPESPEVAVLAQRWRELVELFTGGDPTIEQSTVRHYQEQPEKGLQMGIDANLWAYIGAAIKAL